MNRRLFLVSLPNLDPSTSVPIFVSPLHRYRRAPAPAAFPHEALGHAIVSVGEAGSVPFCFSRFGLPNSAVIGQFSVVRPCWRLHGSGGGGAFVSGVRERFWMDGSGGSGQISYHT